MIQNPILPGFCPDPSIIRVGEDYYIANSSFEWWPGVKIYHSKYKLFKFFCTHFVSERCFLPVKPKKDCKIPRILQSFSCIYLPHSRKILL